MESATRTIHGPLGRWAYAEPDEPQGQAAGKPPGHNKDQRAKESLREPRPSAVFRHHSEATQRLAE